jgi:hypothetical protein
LIQLGGNRASTSRQRPRDTLRRMDQPDRSLHIDLDLRMHGDELAGRAGAQGQAERSFSGWVELLAALDALVEPEPGAQA